MLCGAARAGEPIYELDIPSMNAAQALNRFAEQTGAIMLFSYDLANARRTSAVRGRYTLLEGLELLLRGTGLSGGLSDKRVVNISQSGNVQRPGEEPPVPNEKTSLRKRFTAFFTSMMAASAASSQEANTNIQALEEIIVTAQKREERLQDVPISISVLSGDQLDSSTAEGVIEAMSRVPGVATTASTQTGGTQVTVRGVTAGAALFSGSSPIAYYIDSVPFGLVKTAIAPNANAFDLRQIEVLRGPQGTLYGASAQNGVMRVLTSDPNMNEFEFKARTSASSTEDGGESYRGDAALNVPIVDGKLAARAVVGYQDSSGWIDRPNRADANDAELTNARLKVTAQPTEALTMVLSTWSSRSDYGAPNSGTEQGRHASLADESIETDYDAHGLKLLYDFSAFTATSMTSYLEYENRGNLDLAVLDFPAVLFTGLDAKVFAEEIALTSTTEGPWRWSVGAFYRDAEDRLRQNNLGGGAPFDYANSSESFAFFGEIGRRFGGGQWEWTLGARYFEDDVFVRENINQGAPGDPIQNNKHTYDSTTSRAVLTWYPSDETTVYVSYSEGFRSGFDQDPGVAREHPNFPPLKPDTLHNYELGTKNVLLDRKVSFEAAVYYMDWEDVQQVLNVPFNGTTVSALVNGDSASGIGIDLALSVRPVEALDLALTVSWNDLQMDTDVFSGGQLLFAKGDRLNYSPEYTASALADYVFPIGRNGFEGQFAVSGNYISERSFRTIFGGSSREATGDNILISRASFTVNAPKGWSASLFVDNLNNEQGSPLEDLLTASWSQRVRPRTVGLQLEYHF
jgi:iron complex outermembrane recepter protein